MCRTLENVQVGSDTRALVTSLSHAQSAPLGLPTVTAVMYDGLLSRSGEPTGQRFHCQSPPCWGRLWFRHRKRAQ